MDTAQITKQAAGLMPDLIGSLEQLVAIPSIAFPGFPSAPVEEMGRGAAVGPRGRVRKRRADERPGRAIRRSMRRSRARKGAGSHAVRALRRPARPAGTGLDLDPWNAIAKPTDASTVEGPPTTRAV